MRIISFHKAVASGNDFVIIKNRTFSKSELRDTAIKLCSRKYGVGADGLLVAESSKRADLKMRIFNSDGTEAEMCGNGMRSFILWAYNKKLIAINSFIETKAGIIIGKVKKDDFIKIKIGASFEYRPNLKVKVDGKTIEGDYLDTGVPHFVVEVSTLCGYDVFNIGSKIRHHSIFKPRGTNVDFMHWERGYLAVRTYERGVETETLACGTGCVASALIAGLKRGYDSKNIVVLPLSGERLRVSYSYQKGRFSDVYLEGEAELLFESKFKIK
ncbi:MAG: diaminopimelate epimerase [Candidatus Kaelpia imicola]|nr:diaminopimelate epimerase [Candidatus Kaelpia imicola]